MRLSVLAIMRRDILHIVRRTSAFISNSKPPLVYFIVILSSLYMIVHLRNRALVGILLFNTHKAQ